MSKIYVFSLFFQFQQAWQGLAVASSFPVSGSSLCPARPGIPPCLLVYKPVLRNDVTSAYKLSPCTVIKLEKPCFLFTSYKQDIFACRRSHLLSEVKTQGRVQLSHWLRLHIRRVRLVWRVSAKVLLSSAADCKQCTFISHSLLQQHKGSSFSRNRHVTAVESYHECRKRGEISSMKTLWWEYAPWQKWQTG